MLLGTLFALGFAGDEADKVFLNGNIHTLARGRVEAIAVREGGRILAVGTNAEIERLAGKNTRRIDLGGRTVTPGLIDAHGHLASLGSLLTGRLDLREARSYEEVVAAVKRRAAKAKPGEWITGGRWDQATWAKKELPHHGRLSEEVPDHPVLLSRVDGHAALANRRAMALAGITRDTPNPAGGEILRDGAGEPTGLFVDNAIDLFDRVLPRGRSVRDELLAAQERCLAVGLTGVHDAGVGAETIEAYRKLDLDGKLELRIYAMASVSAPEWFSRNRIHVGIRFTLRSAKLMIDGAMGSRGAWLLADYSDRPGHRGLAVTDPRDLYRLTRAALENGWQVCTHAIGDRGIRETLDAYERALSEVRPGDPRLRIEHVQCAAVEDLPRFARLGVIPSMQFTHATSDMRWAEDRVGPERIRGAYAWATLLRSGARIAAGSDFPVESENPLLGLYAAVTRQDAEGRPEGGWRAQERLTREEALRAFTIDAARAAFEEEDKGTLEPGKLADFVVWSHDLLTCEPRELLKAAAIRVVIGGRTVYEAK